ncbi:MAG: hypothetical protein WCG87_00370 [Bacteroidota bacterium]
MKRIYYFILVTSVLGISCIKKSDFAFNNLKIDNWTPDWAFPLLNAQLTLKNLVKSNNVVTEDSTGLYSLHYDGKLFSAKASDYIFIPNQSYSSGPISLHTPLSIPSFTGTVSDSFSNHFSYTDTSGAQLEHIKIKAGTLNFHLASTYRQNISLQLSFPNIINTSGSALNINANISYPSSTSDVSIDLSNYTIDLTNGNTTRNYMAYKINYVINGSGQSINSSTDSLSAAIDLTNIKYSFIDGTLGHYSIPIPHDTINVAVFNNTLTAQIYLKNPKLHLAFANSLGLGVSAQFDSLYGLTNHGVYVNMNISPISVAGATSIGSTDTSNYTVDSTNSTIQNIFNPAPNQVIYVGHIDINPGGGMPYNFITDQSTISLSADAELPAWFKIIEFSLQDTLKMSLPKDTNILQKAEFKMLVNNAFPVYASIQLYFADSAYNILDSLITPTNNLIPQAPVNSSGVVNGSTLATSDFIYDHDRYHIMASKVRYGFIRGNLKSSGTNSVQIHSSDNINIKLGFRFMLNVSTSL